MWSSLTPTCDFKSAMIIWLAHCHIGKAQTSLHICNLAGAIAARILRIDLLKSGVTTTLDSWGKHYSRFAIT